MLLRKNHLHAAIQTGDIDALGGPDGVASAVADIFSRAGNAYRLQNLCAAVCSCTGYLEPRELVAIYQNVAKAVLQYEVQQSVAR